MPFNQYESIATRYINRFAIDGDDQFEIHVFHDEDTYFTERNQICEAIEEFIIKAKQGSYDIDLRDELKMATKLKTAFQEYLTQLDHQYNLRSMLLTILTMFKQRCITK